MDKTGWTYKKLNELGEIITGGTPPTIDERNYSSSDYCFIKPSDLNDRIVLLDDSEFHISSYAYNNARKLPKGAVLVCCIGSIGKIGILNTEATCNQQINAIIPKSDISSKFIAYSILSSKKRLLNIANAPVVPIINKTQFSKFEIKICSPIEQQYIVEELDSINESISLLQQQVKDLDALAQSIFYDMFGDPIENSKNWEIKPLGSICAEKKEIRRASKCIDKTDKILYIDISSVDQKSNLLTGFTTYTYGEAPSRAQQMVKNGDVLISLVRPNLKNIAIVNTKEENMVASSGFCVLRAKDSTNRFIKYFVLTPQFTEYLVKRVSGANYPAVREEDIKNCAIGIPPIPLQQLFETKIATIEDSKSYFNVQIKDMQTLLASRMQYWFE